MIEREAQGQRAPGESTSEQAQEIRAGSRSEAVEEHSVPEYARTAEQAQRQRVPGELTSLRIAGIMRESIVDGPGIRFAIFCQGCPHDCPGCHNPETHDFGGGTEVGIEKILAAIDEDPILKGVTFSGGEPTCQAEGFAALGRAIKERGLDITMFSGYTYEQLLERAKNEPALQELLDLTDLLIDGPYVKAQRDLTLQFRGSRNQRLIDMKATRQEGKVVLWEQD